MDTVYSVGDSSNVDSKPLPVCVVIMEDGLGIPGDGKTRYGVSIMGCSLYLTSL